MWKDLRHALRTLPRSATTSAIIILTLGLCIGANTAIFSVVDALLLRPLPYPEPNRLVSIVTYYKGSGEEGYTLRQSGRAWENIRDHATFLDAAPYSDGASGVNFSSGNNVEYIRQQRVGAGFFRVLGVPPLIGREFTREEDHPGGPALAVLSYSLWKRIFNQDPSSVGKTLMLRGEPYTIVGVMPENFRGNLPVDLWTPLRPTVTGEGSGTNYCIAARLKTDFTWAQAEGQVESVGASIFTKRSDGSSDHLRLVTLQEGQAHDTRTPILVLWAAVGLVLLIGCANVASILLARSAARGREIATRIALGGGRGAIIRQSLTETAVLAGAGVLTGLFVAHYGIAGLRTLAAKSYGVVESARLDARVLLASAAIAILVTLLAGIFPAFEAGAVDIRSALTEAGTRSVAGGRPRWSRRILVGGEVAIAVLLLIGAGLMIRTVTYFYQLRPGFDPSHILSASFSLQDARYNTAQSVNHLFETGLDRMRRIPGVVSAAAGLSLPYEMAVNMAFQRADGPGAGEKLLVTNYCYVSPGYLETLRIPVLRGRTIRANDNATSAFVTVVNEAFARQYLSRQDPLGSHIKFGDKETREVVGIVADVPQAAGFGDFGPLGSSVPAVYVPVTQMNDGLLRLFHMWFSPSWVIRTAGTPSDTVSAIQDVTRSIDPMIPIAEFRTIDQLRTVTLASQRFQAWLLTALSALALVLAVVGIYGLMAQSVVERRRELGIRIALGATVGRAVRQAVTPGITLALAGVAIGCGLAAMSAKILQHVIWGVSATDPATYALVAFGLIMVAALASLVPALRITRLNPADTLRNE